MQDKTIETLIGFSIIILAGAFLTFAYQQVGPSLNSGNSYNIFASFDDASGINTGTDIRMAGIKIGTVTSQQLEQESYSALLSLAINKEIKLPIDTSAKIMSESLLGGNYVALEPGGMEEYFEEGDEIESTQSSVDLMSIIGKAIFGGENSE